MNNNIFENYINSIASKFSYEETSEMGYRTDFEQLLKHVFSSINNTHVFHDSRKHNGSKPDFIVLKDEIPLLYIEVKDIGVSLDKVEKSEQMSRYYGYANLILSDYLEFRFYRNGIPYAQPIKIGNYDMRNRNIISEPENFEYLAKTIIDFTQSYKEPIRSGAHLAKIMGGKAQRIRDNIREILASQKGDNSELMNVYNTIKKLLVHDLTTNSFADMYAQTLVYGLFVARFYDTSLESFSRQKARELIPASNPFLANFFDHIAGRNFEKRISFIVDELCEVFTHANVAELMEQHFKVSSKKGTQRGQDQVIHFYEDFLKEYDESLRKKMGAYYTPLPVVQFIVRAVDYLLEKEFGLVNGLANTSKTENNLHKVQILDPAVGTGTFISDVIGKIYKRIKDSGQNGRWPSYVHHELLPRLYGFELMMAPYTIAHLKLSMALKETGFLYFNETRVGKARLGIYLTNSLEEMNKQPELLAFDFGASIAEEAKEASRIKNEKPIMVVLGNPPYSVSSSNKGEWIQNLTKIYKKDLDERNIQPLSDDYIKFIRFAEHFIEKNKTGIVAMITNNSFIDGNIHRQMRKHLLETFDNIYILDLHGNSKKKEKTPNGNKDENVFDIQQGVSINIFIRKEEVKSDLGKVAHADLYGKRNDKFDVLNKSSLESIQWQDIHYSEPYYFFVPKDFSLENEYTKGFKIDDLMIVNNSGVVTSNDKFTIEENKDDLWKKISLLGTLSLKELASQFPSAKDSNDWKLIRAREDVIKSGLKKELIIKINYRPFDARYTYYTGRSNGFHGRPRFDSMKNMLQSNIGLLLKKQHKRVEFTYAFVSNLIVEGCVFESAYARNSIFPLYIYSNNGSKVPNFNKDIVSKIEGIIGTVVPEDIFDYMYSVLHSPNYRERYKEFLKIDFPRIPYPKGKETFWKAVKKGKELRELHLMESPTLNSYLTTYPVAGSDVVEKAIYEDGKVYINGAQYFGDVPEVAWNFYIGGYQPAQKWLKDRKGRKLESNDIDYYQKIIKVLAETDRIMKEIDKIIQF